VGPIEGLCSDGFIFCFLEMSIHGVTDQDIVDYES